jgi:MerR family copper efflux transcriptional regulator
MAVRIGEVARKTGLSVHTLRFYERKGLLPAPARGPSNYREFSPASLERLQLIRQAQQLGFTLAQTREILDLAGRRGASCEALRVRAEEKLREVDRQIRSLVEIKKTLKRLMRDCATKTSVAPCTIAARLMPRDST